MFSNHREHLTPNEVVKETRALKIAFETSTMKWLLRFVCMGAYAIQVATQLSEIFTPGVKMPPDKRIQPYRVRIKCKKRNCGNFHGPRNYENNDYCKHCKKWVWGEWLVSDGDIDYIYYDPAYIVYKCPSLENALSLPHFPYIFVKQPKLHFRRMRGYELKRTILLQHNIRLKLLGQPIQSYMPPEVVFNAVRDAFIVRQRTMAVSIICRGLVPLGMHTHVMYEIIVRLVPSDVTRYQIMNIICSIMDRYAKGRAIQQQATNSDK